MADLRMRPRFKIAVHSDAETVASAVRESAAEGGFEGIFAPDHCVLRLPEAQRALWSPELDLTFVPLSEEGDEAPRGVRVRCLFTPRPAVWTGFAFVYAALAAAGLGGLFYGLAQLTLGDSPSALAAAPIALMLIGGIYGATFIGQGLAASQMYELRRVLDVALERAEQSSRSAPTTPLDSAQL